MIDRSLSKLRFGGKSKEGAGFRRPDCAKRAFQRGEAGWFCCGTSRLWPRSLQAGQPLPVQFGGDC